MEEMKERNNLNSQIEDIGEIVELLKKMTDSDRNFIKGMMTGFHTKNELMTKPA